MKLNRNLFALSRTYENCLLHTDMLNVYGVKSRTFLMLENVPHTLMDRVISKYEEPFYLRDLMDHIPELTSFEDGGNPQWQRWWHLQSGCNKNGFWR